VATGDALHEIAEVSVCDVIRHTFAVMPGAPSKAATVALIGVILYALVDIVLQFLPPHYSPIRDAESDLAVGPFGWIQTINYIGRGVTCAFAIVAIASSTAASTRRTIGLVFFAITGLCGALVAFFPTDVVAGGQARTVHGHVHVIAASVGFTCALAAFWFLRGVVRTRLTDLFLLIATAGLVFLGITVVAVPDVFGVAERSCLLGILGWIFVTCARIRAGKRLR
jgi:hypothetical protein